MGGLDAFQIDPRRGLIQAERHSRPPLAVSAPAMCQHILLHTGPNDIADMRRACLDVCEALGLTPESELSDQILAHKGDESLKWEIHTEFVSFTFLAQNVKRAKDFVLWTQREAGWENVPGKLLISLVIGIEKETNAVWKKTGRFDWKNGLPLCASRVMSDTTRVESDLEVNPNGHTRYLVSTKNQEPPRLGRLVQRLIEIEAYGALCLYGWKDVKQVGPEMAEAENRLSDLTGRLAAQDGESDDKLLSDISALSAYHERIGSRSHFRLNASLAYHDIVVRRLNELREERIEGCQRLQNFVLRRMDPAARTYRSILTRQEETAGRISRATQLLRGRTEVAIGKQNQQLLKSMNERAEAQYKLQKTVEGLSIVAITYYVLGILTYLAVPLANVYPGLEVKWLVGLSVPFVMLIAWLGLRRIRD